MSADGDTRDVRSSENLAWDKLAAYLRTALPASVPSLDPAAPIAFEQFPGGHSNLTYLVRFGTVEVVLRRPPLGPVPPRAHDMARESRVLAAVHPHFPLAPRPFLLCEDTSIIGSVFYIMERRHGLVVRAKEPAQIAGNEELRRRISGSVLDTLGDLHAVDVAGHGLDSIGKSAGFAGRQIRGWTERWHGSKTAEIAEMESLAAWLEPRIPADPARPALVHGDYKLDNIMLDANDPSRLAGVFDWEMSAIGDPLIDVGILLAYWVHVASASDESIATVTPLPGWYGRQEILDRYAQRTGSSLEGITLYEVFAIFKLAVVIQQIYARYVRGQTDDPRFASLGERVTSLARIAISLTEKESS